MTPLAVLSPDDLRALVREAVEPLRRELAALREAREAEAIEPAEAARRLNVSVRTVQRMIRRGELPSVQVGRSRRVRLAHLMPPPADLG